MKIPPHRRIYPVPKATCNLDGDDIMHGFGDTGPYPPHGYDKAFPGLKIHRLANGYVADVEFFL